jgi:selenoprotein W-related protein
MTLFRQAHTLIRLKILEQSRNRGLDWRRFADRAHRSFAIPPKPNIAITYCRLCNWLLRAAWMGQELLSTFAEELGSVTLIPDDTGGVFEIRLDDKLIWSRKDHGRFPEIKELKQLVRDEVAPERDLGHVDKKDAIP